MWFPCVVVWHSLSRSPSSTHPCQQCSSQCCSLLVTPICQRSLELHICSLLDKRQWHCSQTSKHYWTDTWTPSWDTVHCGDNSLPWQHSLPNPICNIHVHDNPKYIDMLCLQDLTMLLLYQNACLFLYLQDAPTLHQFSAVLPQCSLVLSWSAGQLLAPVTL